MDNGELFGAASAEPSLLELCRVATKLLHSKMENFLEQRAQNQACLSYAESRQNCYIVKWKMI